MRLSTPGFVVSRVRSSTSPFIVSNRILLWDPAAGAPRNCTSLVLDVTNFELLGQSLHFLTKMKRDPYQNHEIEGVDYLVGASSRCYYLTKKSSH
jgi:hypothetical protein